MKHYQESAWQRARSYLWILLGVSILSILVFAVVPDAPWKMLVPAAGILYVVYGWAMRPWLHVYLDETELRIQKGNKAPQTFSRSTTAFSFSSERTYDSAYTGADNLFFLYAFPDGSEKRVVIDLCCLSSDDFHDLLRDLDLYHPERPIVVETTRKGA